VQKKGVGGILTFAKRWPKGLKIKGERHKMAWRVFKKANWEF